MSWFKPVIIHLIAVAVPLIVALILIRLFGVESPVIQGIIALLAIALEKFVRSFPKIPIGDYVNEN